MTFEDVLIDLTAHVVAEANQTFLVARTGHSVKPFSSERTFITDGGHTFRVKVEFEPNQNAAEWWNVVQN